MVSYFSLANPGRLLAINTAIISPTPNKTFVILSCLRIILSDLVVLRSVINLQLLRRAESGPLKNYLLQHEWLSRPATSAMFKIDLGITHRSSRRLVSRQFVTLIGDICGHNCYKYQFVANFGDVAFGNSLQVNCRNCLPERDAG
jgi:hypothetical protein